MSIFWIIVWIASYANANRETLADGVPKTTITDKIMITVSLLVLLLVIGLIVYGEVSYYLSDKYECESICKKEGFDDYDVDYRDDTPNICICSNKEGIVKEISLG